MPVTRVHQNGFQRGELDETVIARTDLGSFVQGLKKARNVFPLNQGPIERRAGTVFRADLGAQSRLEAFIFNESQEYIFAFQNTVLKIYSTNGTLLQTITGCPWQTSHLFELTFTQQADTMIVCHEAFVQQVIKRTGATTFTRTDFVFKASINASSSTISPLATLVMTAPFGKYSTVSLLIIFSVSFVAGQQIDKTSETEKRLLIFS